MAHIVAQSQNFYPVFFFRFRKTVPGHFGSSDPKCLCRSILSPEQTSKTSGIAPAQHDVSHLRQGVKEQHSLSKTQEASWMTSKISSKPYEVQLPYIPDLKTTMTQISGNLHRQPTHDAKGQRHDTHLNLTWEGNIN